MIVKLLDTPNGKKAFFREKVSSLSITSNENTEFNTLHKSIIGPLQGFATKKIIALLTYTYGAYGFCYVSK